MSKFLAMRISYDIHNGYDIDQEISIREMLSDNGLEDARVVRTPNSEVKNDPEVSDVILFDDTQ